MALIRLPGPYTLLRMGCALADLCCCLFRQVPKRIVLYMDDTFGIAMLRPAKRPKGTEIHTFQCSLLRALRANWPCIGILEFAGRCYTCPEVLDWREAVPLNYDYWRA